MNNNMNFTKNPFIKINNESKIVGNQPFKKDYSNVEKIKEDMQRIRNNGIRKLENIKSDMLDNNLEYGNKRDQIETMKGF